MVGKRGSRFRVQGSEFRVQVEKLALRIRYLKNSRAGLRARQIRTSEVPPEYGRRGGRPYIFVTNDEVSYERRRWPQASSLIKKRNWFDSHRFLGVVRAVCNRDLLGLTYADNRGYKPLPPTINLSLIIMLFDSAARCLIPF